LSAIAGTEKIDPQSKNIKKLIRQAAAVVGVIFFITGIVIYWSQY
jgi:cytochrome b subunit of formate dehydrogenase